MSCVKPDKQLLLLSTYSQFYHPLGILPRSQVIYTRFICFTVDIPMCLSHARTHWHRMENAHSAGLRWHRPRCSTGAGTLGVWQAEKGRREEGKKYCCFILHSFIHSFILHFAFFSVFCFFFNTEILLICILCVGAVDTEAKLFWF